MKVDGQTLPTTLLLACNDVVTFHQIAYILAYHHAIITLQQASIFEKSYLRCNPSNNKLILEP
jgi:hypothetical protein